jgi:glutamate racemase
MEITSAIGVFDSGVGGLTVLKQLIRFLPNENFLYLGDTARVPYGNKSAEIVKRYAKEAALFLLTKNVKMIVVACNTVSSIAIDTVKEIAGDVPVVGMIDFSAIAAYRASRSKNIGIIGTRATIESKGYEKHLKHISGNGNLNLFSKSCPLFVPLVEEVLIDHPATKLIAAEYLSEFNHGKIDTLILGCTHYPALAKIINEILPNVLLIDTGEQSSIQVLRLLAEKQLLNNQSIDFSVIPQVDFYLTDLSPNFKKIAEFLLGFDIENPKCVSLENEQ